MLTSCMMGSTFSLVGVNPYFGGRFEENVTKYGLRDRLASIECMGLTPHELDACFSDRSGAAEAIDSFTAAARASLDKGAEVVIPAGGRLTAFLNAVASARSTEPHCWMAPSHSSPPPRRRFESAGTRAPSSAVVGCTPERPTPLSRRRAPSTRRATTCRRCAGSPHDPATTTGHDTNELRLSIEQAGLASCRTLTVCGRLPPTSRRLPRAASGRRHLRPARRQAARAQPARRLRRDPQRGWLPCPLHPRAIEAGARGGDRAGGASCCSEPALGWPLWSRRWPGRTTSSVTNLLGIRQNRLMFWTASAPVRVYGTGEPQRLQHAQRRGRHHD